MLVHAVRHGAVEVGGPVGGEHEHEVSRRAARVVQQSVERVARVLRHARVGARLQEGLVGSGPAPKDQGQGVRLSGGEGVRVGFRHG